MFASSVFLQRVVAVRHVHFEDLGTLEGVLEERGAEVTYLDAGLDDLSSISSDGPDLLVILGGPIGAYEEEDYPWLANLRSLLAKRIAAKLPTLGICLGAQLIASALGAKVYAGGTRELGWGKITLSEEGMSSPLRHLTSNDCHVLHWHGDTFNLPEGASLLASNDSYVNQAFSFGPNVLGLQFHPEVRARGFDRWLVGHALEIGSTQGQSASGLRQATADHAYCLELQARILFDEWLNRLE
ncbi:glutamine amidotransferase [Paraburkholderia sp.]|uniref:glutamine amidotransferase n=1 Tax=Paraburkholderia sp. TaxID=1926495 RepID=UPI002390FD05|nr:glutamine amidotransferase [Paraburkholderia sp.]MDE1180967.1 glutamine amidotransferase [Paraburkholderia sp.]